MNARRRLHLAYPVLLAVIPILHRQVQNPWPTLGDALAFSAALAAVVVAVQLGCYGLLRFAAALRPSDAAEWAALPAAGAVGLFYYAPAIIDRVHGLFDANPASVVGAACAVAAIAVATWWAKRRGEEWIVARALAPAGRFVARAALLLAGWLGAQIAASRARVAWVVRHNGPIRELASPVPVRPAAAAGPKRDVYVLVLDAYPGADALREVYGVDNTPFLDSLRAIGFHTPARLRSNYPITLVSVSSFLNFAQLDSLTAELPANFRDATLGEYLLEHNRAARFLKSQGYRFVFYPSAWFPPTRHNREADDEFPPPPGVDLARAVDRSLLIDSFSAETGLRPLKRFFPTRQAVITAELTRTFAGVAALASRPAGGRPVFALAHFLMPHGEFLADSACRPYPRHTELKVDAPVESPAVRAALAGWIACTNRQVLATVHAVLARPGPRPIIILQGDHGTTGLGLLSTSADSITPAQVRERYSPFGAYYLPDGGAAAMGEPVSIVNVLRAVFRYYYGADLPPVPNALYFVDPRKPYRLTPIDTLTLRPVLPAREPAGR